MAEARGSLSRVLSLDPSTTQKRKDADWPRVCQIIQLGAAIQAVHDADQAYRVLRSACTHDLIRQAIDDAKSLIRLSHRLPGQVVRDEACMIIEVIEDIANTLTGPAVTRRVLAHFVQLGLLPQREIATALTTDPDRPIDERDIRRLGERSIPALDPASRKLLRRHWATIRRVAALARP